MGMTTYISVATRAGSSSLVALPCLKAATSSSPSAPMFARLNTCSANCLGVLLVPLSAPSAQSTLNGAQHGSWSRQQRTHG